MLSRRTLIIGTVATLAASTLSAMTSSARPIMTRQRIIIDKDFGGDPDGLFQVAHHLLSPSVDTGLVIGSHLLTGLSFGPLGPQSAGAVQQVAQLMDTMRLTARPRVVAGSEFVLTSIDRVPPTDAAEAIIKEALEGDESRPLYYCAGAGLTDLATAWLLEPRIARRMRLVWIGGCGVRRSRPAAGSPRNRIQHVH